MSKFESDMQKELRFHMEQAIADHIANGMTLQEARERAQREFGSVELAKDELRDTRRFQWLSDFLQDARYSLRNLRLHPGFTATAILSLALGIGANTAIFSAVDAVLLRALPYAEADRIVGVFGTSQGTRNSWSPASYLDFQHQSQSFEYLAAYDSRGAAITGAGDPQRIQRAMVTPDFFAVLGVNAQLGRTLNAALDQPGQPRTVVLSYELWQSRFQGNPAILGQTISIDGEALSVAGVMPADFAFPSQADAWIPARYAVPEYILRPTVNPAAMRDSHYFSAIGRLRTGVSLQQASAEMNGVGRRLQQQYGSAEDLDGGAVSQFRSDLFGDLHGPLFLMLAAVAILLAIACVNVANILLARGAARQTEVATRRALGAGRDRLIRQFLTESVVLSAAGGALGIALAVWATPALRSVIAANAAEGLDLRLDVRVLAFTAGVSILCGVLFGLFPALLSSGDNLDSVLRSSGRTGANSRANRLRRGLVIAEIALSAILLTGAGLLVHSFVQVVSVAPGFQTQRVLTMQLTLPQSKYAEPQQRARFAQQILDRVRALPGVTSAAAISRLPLNPGASIRGIRVRSYGDREFSEVDYRAISTGYFRALGVPLLRGRDFASTDDAALSSPIIVTAAFARQTFPGKDPLTAAIGQRVRTGPSGLCNREDAPASDAWCEIIGVAGDIRQRNLEEESRPGVYAPYSRDPWTFLSLIVQVAGEPALAASSVQATIHSIDAEQPVADIRTMNEVAATSVAPRKTAMLLLGLFALLAVILACIGIYGVMSYSVARRSKEIGLRIALGADRANILRLIARESLLLTTIGIAIGLVVASGLVRFLSKALYQVAPSDAITFAGTAGILLIVASLASFVPARRAVRVDPITTLRCD